MISFPDIGSTVRRQIFDPPAKNGETEDAHKALVARHNQGRGAIHGTFKLVGPGRAFEWQMRLRSIRLKNAAELSDLRKGHTRDTAPEFWEEDQFTESSLKEIRANHLEILRECLAGLDGFKVGPRDVADAVADDLVKIVDQCGMSGAFVDQAIRAQSPTEDQYLS